MNFFQKLFRKKQFHHKEPVLSAIDESIQNITEGSEFLDDAIRMKEQPYSLYTEESIAPGSPENLW